MNEHKDIYKLNLHETTIIHKDNCSILIMRVPGGWTYSIDHADCDYPSSCIFIAYDLEFYIEEKI